MRMRSMLVALLTIQTVKVCEVDSLGSYARYKLKGRGVVVCSRLTKMKENEHVDVVFNQNGQRIGEGGKDLASYSGLHAASRVSIATYDNWHDVKGEARDRLWKFIKGKFNLEDHEMKGTLQDIGEKWREFKNRLTRFYITPFKDQLELLRKPPKVYEKYISQEDWDKFVKSRLTDEFQAGCRLLNWKECQALERIT
ncbi:hypothetical protein IFM89_025844 [Coptis chinensis]|uniref:Uncharacterized protein n=1 Tax=Coptis chinensis TaxID=261450 RepID=A0A835HD13_9MAGN|nr:hypothetical protein IFM89_025844 [Coptis chinensis]